MSDQDFLRRFEACELPLSAFPHEAHVRLGWLYLSRHPLPEAMILFRDSLRRFAAFHGKDGLYHETITFGFLLLIHDRIRKQPAQGGWDGFRERHPDLLDWRENPLRAAYKQELLFSELARSAFVLPD